MKSFLDKHSSVIALDFHINRVSIPFRIISFAFLIVHISLYSLNSITSDEKIQITILILRRGALSRFTCNYCIWLFDLKVKLLKIVGRMFLIKWTTYIWGSRDLASCMFASMSFPCVIIRFVFFLYCQLSSHNTVQQGRQYFYVKGQHSMTKNQTGQKRATAKSRGFKILNTIHVLVK